jgi:hypothetical protein
MNFDIPAARAPTDGAARPLDRSPKRLHHVFAHCLGPFPGEGGFVSHNAILHKGGVIVFDGEDWIGHKRFSFD